MNVRLGWCVGLLLFIGSGRELSALAIASPAFSAGQGIAPRFARTHENVSPPLQISAIPSGTKSLALIVDDPDAPGGLFTHWLLWNIPPGTRSIAEGASASTPPGVEGRNSFGDTHYDGPAPPNGRHRYFFHLYALDTTLGLPVGAGREELLAAMQGHVLARAQIFGTFATGQ